VRLARLLGWMEMKDFDQLQRSGLLSDVEEIVVEAHRSLYLAKRKPWSRPVAYHLLRYEDPAPTTRLAAGVRKLRRRGAKFDPDAVDKACARASKMGYLN
jgi:hypothetical protein